MRYLMTAILVLTSAVSIGAEDLIREDRERLREIRALVHEAVGDMESGEISVELDRGVVTLSGELNRLSHLDGARYAAAEVPGVLEIRSEVDVATAIFDADMIEDAVLEVFRTNYDLAALGLEVDSAQGEVTLTGEAPDGNLKLLAESMAAGVDGVVSVVNEISTPYSSDKDIQGVLNALLEGAETQAVEDVRATVSGGYVSMEGTVPLLVYAYLARDAARAVNGVSEVTLAIEVIPPEYN